MDERSAFGVRLPRPPRQIRAIGFDDAPFTGARGSSVALAGVVCSGTRFEGLVWGRIRRDGWNATSEIVRLLVGGKFLPQLHVVLLDGIAFGGLNLVDLPRLAAELKRPCIAVMRRRPDLAAMERAIRRLSRPDARLRLLERAGPLHFSAPFVFQIQGGSPELATEALHRLTDRGNVPEPLRLAHLIGAAVRTGESGKRA